MPRKIGRQLADVAAGQLRDKICVRRLSLNGDLLGRSRTTLKQSTRLINTVSLPLTPVAPRISTEDGTRIFFGGPRRPYGAMAERTVVRRAQCFSVPRMWTTARPRLFPTLAYLPGFRSSTARGNRFRRSERTLYSRTVEKQGTPDLIFREMGVEPGERVSCMGDALSDHAWAHMARVKISAEIPDEDTLGFCVAHLLCSLALMLEYLL